VLPFFYEIRQKAKDKSKKQWAKDKGQEVRYVILEV